MVDLIKCQIIMANLTKPWHGHLDGPLVFLIRCLVCHMVKKVTLVECLNQK
jgi:hypothetical protein